MSGGHSIIGAENRLAIIGAGPAGCLVASALVDAAAIRGVSLSISLYGAGTTSRGDEVFLADDAALAHLAAAGLPSPALMDRPLKRLRFQAGAAALDSHTRWFSLVRDEVVGGLRACAAARGVRLVQRRVEELAQTVDGGWVLRAHGASERADRIILACGAGASIAGRHGGHLSPPLWRGCVASLEIDEELAARLDGTLVRIRAGGAHPELSVVSHGRLASVYAHGVDVGPKELGLALLAATSLGALPGRFRLRGIRRIHAPGGVARPGLPTVGAALGGIPACSLLALAGSQAQRLAAACFGDDLLHVSIREARALEGALERRRRLQRSLRRFGDAALEAAVRDRHPEDAPLPRLIAEAAGPGLREAGPMGEGRTTIGARVAVFFRLLFAFLAFAWHRLLETSARRRAPTPPPPRRRMVYVVEDDPECADLLGAALDQRRIPYRRFANGIEAAAMAPLDRPAAIVLDVVLPWIDGAQLSHELKAGSDVSILLTTSLPRTSLLGRRSASADQILTKPLDPELVAARLARFLPPPDPGGPAPGPRSG